MWQDDPHVISLAIAVFPFGAAFQISDGLQSANSGVLRAVGKVKVAAQVNLVAYYGEKAFPLDLHWTRLNELLQTIVTLY